MLFSYLLCIDTTLMDRHPPKTHASLKLDAGLGKRQMGLGLFKVVGIENAGEPSLFAGEPLFSSGDGNDVSTVSAGEVTSRMGSPTNGRQSRRGLNAATVRPRPTW